MWLREPLHWLFTVSHYQRAGRVNLSGEMYSLEINGDVLISHLEEYHWGSFVKGRYDSLGISLIPYEKKWKPNS